MRSGQAGTVAIARRPSATDRSLRRPAAFDVGFFSDRIRCDGRSLRAVAAFRRRVITAVDAPVVGALSVHSLCSAGSVPSAHVTASPTARRDDRVSSLFLFYFDVFIKRYKPFVFFHHRLLTRLLSI